MFLSRLNETSGGRGNLFSFGIIAENDFEVFENDIFDWKVLWMVRANGILLVSSFYGVCSVVSQSISRAQCLPVVTTGTFPRICC